MQWTILQGKKRGDFAYVYLSWKLAERSAPSVVVMVTMAQIFCLGVCQLNMNSPVVVSYRRLVLPEVVKSMGSVGLPEKVEQLTCTYLSDAMTDVSVSSVVSWNTSNFRGTVRRSLRY